MAASHSSPAAATSLTELTPLRAHYLKRELVTLQFVRELAHLDSPEALALLGPPFYPQARFVGGLPQAAPSPGSEAAREEQRAREALPDLPFLTFVFNHFVLSFPFLANCPPTFFSHKLQPLVYSFVSRNISTGADDDEVGVNKPSKVSTKVEKKLGLVMSAAIKVTENEGREEIVRIAGDGSLVVAVPASHRAEGSSSVDTSTLPPSKSSNPEKPQQPEGYFVINVVAVRNAVVKGRVRNKNHEEFIVRTRRAGMAEVFVTRRYGDFTRLAEALRAEYPGQDVLLPPSKDRRTTDARVASPPHSGRNSVDLGTDGVQQLNLSATTSSSAPKLPTLSRERNRLTLRAWLRTILGNPVLASSSLFQSFLLADPIDLAPQEMQDVELREEMDRIREEEVRSFRAEVDERVSELEGYLRTFKEDLVRKDGLTRVFATIRETPAVTDLPAEFQKVLEWARISLASTIYSLFLGADDSSATFASLKRTHGMMPYFVMRSILRISNPIAMLRGILELFLARPFGSTSLLQKMFSSGLSEEARKLKEESDIVAAKIDDEDIVEKLQRYVEAPKEVQLLLQVDAAAEGLDLMSVILRSGDEPQLAREALQRVQRASVAYQEYKHYRSELVNLDDDEGPDNDDAWLFEDLHVLLRILTKTRDKEQLVELIFEGSTSEVLKDMITIFYEPLAKVYKAANIADSLYDLQVFITDLIKTVESAEDANLDDPHQTVQTFVDLVGRHEDRFYNFVHQVHSKGEGLFDNLMKWIELFINFVRDGLPTPISLEFLLPHGGKQRRDLMREVDLIIDYHRKIKAAHHDKVKRRMIAGESTGSDADAAFMTSVMENFQVGSILGDVNEVEEEESEEEDDESDDEYESVPETSPVLGGAKALPLLPGQLVPIPRSGKAKKKSRTVIDAPKLTHIPLLVPVFVELVRDELRASRTRR